MITPPAFLGSTASHSTTPLTIIMPSLRLRMLLSLFTHSTLLITLLSTTASALPTTDDDNLRNLLESRYHYLSARSCANPCGTSGLCCGTGQTCTTNAAGQATCGGTSNQQAAAASPNGWEYYTTTYVETDLVTRISTYSSFFGNEASTAAPGAASGLSCTSALGESPCGGSLCCAAGQYCAYAGQCAASNGQGDSSSSAFTFESTTTAAVATNSAPVRPTSHAATTVTSTGSATTTVPYQTPTAASATAGAAGMTATTMNNGLSGGAIAGIVIGVLAGLLLLFLLCAFLCCKGIIDGILDFFGLRSRRRRETIIEERHAHHSSSGAPMRRNWYGAPRPARIEKKKSGIGGMTAVAGGLGALAVILGLKRRRDDRRDRREKTESEYSYDSNYYTGTSPSK